MIAGISSYTYTWAIGLPGHMPEKPMSIYQLIEKASALRAGVVQVADNLPLHQFKNTELERIKQFALDHQIQIETGARSMTPANLDTYIHLSRIFESPILRFVIDGPGFRPSLGEIHSIIKQGLPSLEDAGIVLAIENHDRFYAREFVEIVQKAESPNVAICLDTVNSMGAGEGLESVIKRLAPLTVNLHVKEFKIERVFHQMGFVIEGCPLGEGMLPLEQLIRELPATCRSAILEQWTPPEDSLEKTIEKEARWATQSITQLHKVLQISKDL